MCWYEVEVPRAAQPGDTLAFDIPDIEHGLIHMRVLVPCEIVPRQKLAFQLSHGLIARCQRPLASQKVNGGDQAAKAPEVAPESNDPSIEDGEHRVGALSARCEAVELMRADWCTAFEAREGRAARISDKRESREYMRLRAELRRVERELASIDADAVARISLSQSSRRPHSSSSLVLRHQEGPATNHDDKRGTVRVFVELIRVDTADEET